MLSCLMAVFYINETDSVIHPNSANTALRNIWQNV